MVATVTGLGGQGGERRQPRPGGSNQKDPTFFRSISIPDKDHRENAGIGVKRLLKEDFVLE